MSLPIGFISVNSGFRCHSCVGRNDGFLENLLSDDRFRASSVLDWHAVIVYGTIRTMLSHSNQRTISRLLSRLFLCPAMGIFMPFVFAELPEKIPLRHLAALPHDKHSFTQGLLWDGGYLYESAGQYGTSSLRRVEPKTGNVTARVDLPQQFFAEGLALAGSSLFQLTWQENVCFVYDKKTLQLIGQFQYPGEGWGLTYDGKHLILSDGTNALRFFDPQTFKLQRRLDVFDTLQKRRPEPVRSLNELEWVHGEIWANVWTTTRIVRINPKNGHVIGWIEMASFVPEEHRDDTHNCVLNGIAFDPATNHVYITGKYWNVIHQFQIEISEKK